MVLIILDNLNIGNFRVEASKTKILGDIANRLESMARRRNLLFPAVAERYQRQGGIIRAMMMEQPETGRT